MPTFFMVQFLLFFMISNSKFKFASKIRVHFDNFYCVIISSFDLVLNFKHKSNFLLKCADGINGIIEGPLIKTLWFLL